MRNHKNFASRLWRMAAAGSAVLLAVTLSGCAELGLFAAEPAPPEPLHEDLVPWQDCGDEARCATVQVPLDWSAGEFDTTSTEFGSTETVNLALLQLPATTKRPLGTIFVNPGGPGASGVDYLDGAAEKFQELRKYYNIAAWDPRGVNLSTNVTCLSDAEMDEYLFGDPQGYPEPGTPEWLAEVRAENADYARGCVQNSGQVYQHVSTVDTVKDLDHLRYLVGDAKLNYFGFSYGTYIGAIYADTYPDLVGHLVLDGAMDPGVNTEEVVRVQTQGFELALKNYLADCVQRECWGSGDVDAHVAEIQNLLAAVDAEPLRGSDGRYLSVGGVITAIATPLYSQDSWWALDELFQQLQAGETQMAFYLNDFYYDRDSKGKYTNNSTQAFRVINCLDYQQTDPDLQQLRRDAEALAKAAPIFGKYQGYSGVSCLDWPGAGTDARTTVTATGADPILVIGTAGDPATPLEWAKSLASQLESGVLLEYRGEGHTAYGSSKCVNRAVRDYFVADQLPPSGTQCS